MCTPPEVYVHALYDFDYEAEPGKKISMREGEEFLLIKKTNDDWWQVIRDGDKRSFYAPANYLEEIQQPGLRRPKRPPSSTSSVSSFELMKPRTCNSADGTCTTAPPTQSNPDHPPPSSSEVNKVVVVTMVQPNRAKKSSLDVLNENITSRDDHALESSNHVTSIIVNSPSYKVEVCKPLGSSTRKPPPFAKQVSLTELTKDKYEKEKDNRFITEELDKNRRNKENLSDVMCPLQRNTPGPPNGKLVLIKTSQSRPPSPIYANYPLVTSPSPPLPKENEFPVRCLDGNWAEFEDSQGRKYYFNLITKEKSWKPPRRKSSSNSSKFLNCVAPDICLSGLYEDPTLQRSNRLCRPSPTLAFSAPSSKENSPQPNRELDVNLHSPTPESPFLPPGWMRDFDPESREVCYVNDLTKERWFTSTDEFGRIYYYEENAAQSFWQLPEVVIAEVDSGRRKQMRAFLTTSSSSLSDGRRSPCGSSSPPRSPPLSASPRFRPLSLTERGSRTRSMVLMDARFIVAEDRSDIGSLRSSTLPRNASHHLTSVQRILKQDLLFKTKLSEGGKRTRKNWTTSFVILTESALLFYKDGRSAQVKCNSPHSKPEFYADLAGSKIEWAADKSSRKNVFQVSTVSGAQILLQDENAQLCNGWFEAIKNVVAKLPSGGDLSILGCDNPSPEENKRFRLTRAKSSKRIDSKGSGSSSTEDLDSFPAERKMRIRDKLINFFLRRPSMESLREKGILKEEPVFGCYLYTLCAIERTVVPKFVQHCISAIEEKDMTADGLYRASGNLSQVQKIRYQVNQDNLDILKTEEDVHVLTGALKLFFRELKEPLFPFSSFEPLLRAIGLIDRQHKLQVFTELIHNLPRPNYNTLKFLLEHLLRITQYSDKNRMHIHNLAIVFGPTLMWPVIESANLALDMMHQNQIIEYLLLEFASIFR